MTFAVFCIALSILVLCTLKKGDKKNPNGLSVSLLQNAICALEKYKGKRRKLAIFFMASANITENDELTDRQKKIERLVWIRLMVISSIALIFELIYNSILEECHAPQLLMKKNYPKELIIIAIFLSSLFILYIIITQFTLMTSLLGYLFGASLKRNEKKMTKKKAYQRTPYIVSPRRSLLMAIINFLEIIIAWAIIYRFIVPNIITSMETANYFSVVTLTTLGYGDINAGKQIKMQLAVTGNMIVFLLFTICHVTTIMGAMSSGNNQNDPEK